MKPRGAVRVLLLAMLLVGAFGAGQWINGSASAQRPQKWEYKLVRLGSNWQDEHKATGTKLNQDLADLGDHGWEAVGINESAILLRRGK